MSKKSKAIKDINISVRCSQAEHEMIMKHAAEANMTRSKYMVKAAAMGSEGVRKEVSKKKKYAKICKIRTLLNELPKSAEVEALHQEVDELWKL